MSTSNSAPAPSPHLPVRPAWLALHTEAALEPDLPIIDPHHHIWDHANNPYLYADVAADVSAGHRIVATVFAECSAMYRRSGPAALASLGETEYVHRAAQTAATQAPCRIAAGIVGNVNLLLGDETGAVLDAHLEGVDTAEQQVQIACDKAGIRAGEPVALERFKVDRYH